MHCSWMSLVLLLSGVDSFMIHNTHHSLCLEDTAAGLLLLKVCNLGSEFQQWMWLNQNILRCVGTSRCLSAQHRHPVQTVSCEDQENMTNGLLWDCEGDRLINQHTSLDLTSDGSHLILSNKQNKHAKWRSLEKGDICQEKLRTRRNEPEEFEVLQNGEEQAAMTEEQRKFFQWFYRTEDPSAWKFAMLALSFTCLMVGFMMLGMGSMANRNRKKIAKYKAVAALVLQSQAEELSVLREFTDCTEVKTTVHPETTSCLQNSEAEGPKTGDIVVTWKDGKVSTLYSEPAAEVEVLDEKETNTEEEEIKP